MKADRTGSASLRTKDELVDDIWSSGGEPGRSTTWHLAGREGLQRLSGPMSYQASDPEQFHATLTRVRLDHVALEALEASAHEVARTSDSIKRFPTELLTFVLVVEGRLHIELKSGGFELEAGRFAVIDSRDEMTLSSSVDVRLLRFAVGMEHLPKALQRRSAPSPARFAAHRSWTASSPSHRPSCGPPVAGVSS